MADEQTLRRFTATGIDEWVSFLRVAKEDSRAEIPTGLLTDAKHSEPVSDAVVPPGPFHVRREAADAVTTLLSKLPESMVEKDAGLWDWLTLWYFDSVAPPEDGRRDVKNAYRYHFQPDSQRHWYRHLLYIGWHARRVAKGYDRLFLERKVDVLDRYTEDLFRVLSITRLPAIFEVLDRIHWDEEAGRPRMNMAGPDTFAGDLTHRLPRRLDQLTLTYDLHSLSADRLIDLLGPEFQRLDRGPQASTVGQTTRSAGGAATPPIATKLA